MRGNLCLELLMSRRTLIVIFSCACGLSFGCWVLPEYIRARNTPASNACVSNLRNIEGAKAQWGLENHKTTNDAPTMEDIRPYMGRGVAGEIPICPSGGIYTPGRLGEPPTCSIGGPQHSLNYDYSKENMHSRIVGSLFWLSLLGLLAALFFAKKKKSHAPESTTWSA
jgi:hypothetical protein